LLDRPAGQVAILLEAHWGALIDPSARTEDTIALLGLRPLPTLEQMVVNDGQSREQARQLVANSFSGTVPCR
jgi:hypothetical protein